MKTIENEDYTWRVRPYSKKELALAYAPDISAGAALNRLAQWINHNPALRQALAEAGYRPSQRMFTSRQTELIFRYLGAP